MNFMKFSINKRKKTKNTSNNYWIIIKITKNENKRNKNQFNYLISLIQTAEINI